MISRDTTWANVKAMLTSRALSAQWVQVDSFYNIAAIDGLFALECKIFIADAPLDATVNADQIDFETNFKPRGNSKLTAQIDSDNAEFSRTKQAPTGWTYQFRGFEFTTSNLSSLVNRDVSQNALGDVSIKMFDAGAALTTDPTLAVKTVLDFEPTYDYYIIGGLAKILVTPANDVRLSVVAVPDVPFAYGGTRVMIQSVNFKYIGSNDKVDADGRASKMLSYSTTNHTNKLRFIVSHLAGEQHSFSIFVEHYRV